MLPTGIQNVNFPKMRYSAGNNVTASSQILFGSSDVYDLKTVTTTTMSVNQSIVFTQLSQNPTGGDSTVFYNVKYRILNTSDLTVDLT